MSLHVGNLSSDTTDDTLRSCFEQFGVVTKVIVMRDRDTGSSRGFGLVSFDSPSQADLAISCANGKEIDGNCITVKFASGRTTPADGGGGPPRRFGGGGYDGGGYDGGGYDGGGYGGGH